MRLLSRPCLPGRLQWEELQRCRELPANSNAQVTLWSQASKRNQAVLWSVKVTLKVYFAIYPFYSYKSVFFHPPCPTSVQHFERENPEGREIQKTRPFILHHVYSVQRGRQQEQKAHHHYYFKDRGGMVADSSTTASTLSELSRETAVLESPSNIPETLWFRAARALPSVIAAEWVFVKLTVVRALSMPLGQDTQGAAEWPKSQRQQLWGEGSA